MYEINGGEEIELGLGFVWFSFCQLMELLIVDYWVW